MEWCFCCKALSKKCKAEIHRDGFVFTQEYDNGFAQGEVKKGEKSNKTNKYKFYT